MPVVLEFDFLWHENPLIISLLAEGPLTRQQLYERLRERQRRIKTPVGTGLTHSTSSYRYWINQLKAGRIVEEYERILCLTPLGKWVANSGLGTIFERERFTHLICQGCDRPLALLMPLPNTTEVNAEGTLFMDFECPRCHSLHRRCNLSRIAEKDDFMDFYDRAAAELERTLKIEVHRM